MDYVHAVRVEKAKRIIERDAGGIDDVAYEVGYEDPTFFRRLFKREVGLTPAAYRRKYSSILSDPAPAEGDH
jgi:AraC-like DNA-binding protein